MSRGGEVAPGYYVEHLLTVAAVLCLWTAAVAQRFEIVDRKLRYRLFKASRLFEASKQGLMGAGALPLPSPGGGGGGGLPRRTSSLRAGRAAMLRTTANDAAPSDVSQVKVMMNAWSCAVLVVMLVRCIDPQGSQDHLGVGALVALGMVSSTMLSTVAMVVFYQNIELGMRVAQLSVRPGTRGILYGFLALLWGTTVGSLFARIWTLDAFWTMGVYVWTLCACVLFVVAEVCIGVRMLRAAGDRFSSSTSVEIRKRLPALAEAIDKLVATRTYVIILAVFLVPLQIAFGYRLSVTDENINEFSQVDFSTWHVGSNAFLWTELFAVGVIIWYSWTPFASRPERVALDYSIQAAARSGRTRTESVGSEPSSRPYN